MLAFTYSHQKSFEKKKHLRQVFRNIIAFRSFSVLKIHKDYCVVEN